jgi:UDPglucose--hexose-1-phosphate uridylyltransferase
VTELRQDRTSGAWVIVAPARKLRPKPPSPERSGPAEGRAFDPACPFCPGNEAQLPGILAETPASAPPGWQVRVVPNKYPALAPDAPHGPSIAGPHVATGGYGAHEVVVEHPRHDADLAALDDAAMHAIVRCYHARFTSLAAQPRIETVVLFRNHGAASGSSLPHPHAQLVALPLTTPRLAALATWGRQRYDEEGHCVTCSELELERAAGDRVVSATPHFLSLVPFAAERPGEIWLVPTRHQASFAESTAEEIDDFGAVLRDALRRLKAAYGNLAYNFVVDSGGQRAIGAPHIHWRLRILPNLVTWGGFELGTGIPINPSSPEQDAAALRDAAIGGDSV